MGSTASVDFLEQIDILVPVENRTAFLRLPRLYPIPIFAASSHRHYDCLRDKILDTPFSFFFLFCHKSGLEISSLCQSFYIHPFLFFCAGIAQSVWRLATGWKVRKWNRAGGEILRTRLDRACGPPNLLQNGYRLSFPLTLSAEVKERVKLNLYSPSWPSWPVLGRTLPFTFLPLSSEKYVTYNNHAIFSVLLHVFAPTLQNLCSAFFSFSLSTWKFLLNCLAGWTAHSEKCSLQYSWRCINDHCKTSGFRRRINKIFVLRVCYTA